MTYLFSNDGEQFVLRVQVCSMTVSLRREEDSF